MLLAGIFALSLAVAPECTAEHAVYKLRGTEVTAGFTKQAVRVQMTSDTFFWIRTEDGRKWWFAMWSPNGYGGAYLTPDKDATRLTEADNNAARRNREETAHIDFDSFDENFDHIPGPLQSDDPAPAHLFARGLGPLLWYDSVIAANGDETAPEESIPTAFYDRVGCDASAQ